MKIIIGSRTFTFDFGRRSLFRALGAVALVAFGIWVGRDMADQGGRPQPVAVEPLDPEEARLSPEGRALVETATRGAVFFIFFHELGHMAINQLDLPATGPEEDTADEFSAFTMASQLASDNPQQQMLAATILSSGANFNRLFAKLRAESGPEANMPWYDEHSPDERRFSNILCIAVGASDRIYGQIALGAGMPPERIERCKLEYAKKQAAWNTLMEPHEKGAVGRFFGTGGRLLLQIGGAPAPGHPVAADVPRAQILRSIYTGDGFFQALLDQISDVLVLPRDIPVIVRSCGMVNAFWDPQSQTITLCDEMVAVAARIFTRYVGRDEQPMAQAPVTVPIQGGGVPQPNPGVPPVGAPQPGQAGPQPGGGWPQPGQTAPQPGQTPPQPGGGWPQPGQNPPPPGGGWPQPGQAAPQPGQTPPQPGGGWPQPGQTVPQAPAQGRDVRAAMVGKWFCQGVYLAGDTHGRTSSNVVLAQDGSLQIDGQDTNGNRLRITGRWSMRGAILVYQIDDYQPKELCAPWGCQPLHLPREIKSNVVIDPDAPSNQITVGDEVCSRDPG